MKPLEAKILQGKENEVFGTKVVELPYFSTTFHFHEECQITYVVESAGTRMIGDSIERFSNDELIMVGSNIPHVWHNSEEYFLGEQNENQAKSLSLFINPEKTLKLFSQFGNVQNLARFFQLSKRGIKFRGKTKAELKSLLVKMAKTEEMLPRLRGLTDILDLFCQTDEFDLIMGIGYTNTYQLKDNDRMDVILKYIFNNFSKEIQLNDIADMIGMNKQAFCRYFKSRTQKTFMGFVNEVRIGNACKLISEGDYQISHLAYECGFNNLSNFNKFFKQMKGVTPKEYRRKVVSS
ncbi:AraC family transcriptional regulator [Pedobacter nototheniae]|uniref:AraC family transcriptional regulator n=1 Tax=Pedobacter nototheniae TaxID=2488994 RepID=UPI002931B977|nr:AraC family transcriptional regulator [Pedobacter nototheniae]